MRDGFGEPQEKCRYCGEWYEISMLSDGVCPYCDIEMTEFNDLNDMYESDEN